jgi:hypothetical protein
LTPGLSGRIVTPPQPTIRSHGVAPVHQDCGWIDVRGLIVGKGEAPRLHITEIYIPLRTSGGEYVLPGESVDDALDLTLRHRKLVIVGDPGGGKSTYLKLLSWRQSGPDATQFPIRLRISELEDFIYKRLHTAASDAPAADSPDWLARLLAHQSAEFHWGLDADFFRSRLREPSTLILLDGLDEVPNAERRAAIARLFERATKAYRGAHFVVTTRPACEGTATLADFETVRIGEFGKSGTAIENLGLASVLRARLEWRSNGFSTNSNGNPSHGGAVCRLSEPSG